MMTPTLHNTTHPYTKNPHPHNQPMQPTNQWKTTTGHKCVIPTVNLSTNHNFYRPIRYGAIVRSEWAMVEKSLPMFREMELYGIWMLFLVMVRLLVFVACLAACLLFIAWYLTHHMCIYMAMSFKYIGGWSSQILNEKLIQSEKDDRGRWYVGYLATVRVTLLNGASHEDCGSGEAINDSKIKAHEKAIKSAVTDAMKRAARHFGERGWGMPCMSRGMGYGRHLERIGMRWQNWNGRTRSTCLGIRLRCGLWRRKRLLAQLHHQSTIMMRFERQWLLLWQSR